MATSQASKAMLVGPAKRSGADVESTFGQVDITNPLVDWGDNYGSLTAAVGPFAVDEGLVRAGEPATIMRIYNAKANKTIVATVPTGEGRVLAEGDYSIPEVPSPGARVDLKCKDRRISYRPPAAFKSATVGSAARWIMAGYIYVPRARLAG